MIDLPDFEPLRVSQTTSGAGRPVFESIDHVAVIVPKRPPAALFRRLPQGTQLRRLLARAHSHEEDRVSSRLSNTRATGVTLGALTPGSAFEELTWARKLVADCLRDSPRSLGILVLGLPQEARSRVLERLVSAAGAAAFKLPNLKSKKKNKTSLSRVKILDAQPRMDFSRVQAQVLGNNVARWLTALPPNELDAASYRIYVEALSKEHGIACSFIDERQLDKLGAGAFLAVSQGNAARDAGILHLKYRPRKQKGPDLTLVGKGIVFDTGGTNLKPFKSMLDMHTDMQGSAVALGCLIALARLEVPFAVDAWLAVTENRISATAYKSQDVIRAANGKTIQVIHTDAEGRMVLADTLTLAAREEPKLMIDYATLTGSCVAALTDRYSGVFSNRQAANELLLRAGAESGERVWPFPMDNDYDEMIRSEIADIKQCAAAGSGDHILAARFLSHFVPDSTPWVHVDLSAGQHEKGLAHIPSDVTGFGVRLTLELLRAGTPQELAAKIS